METAAEGRQWAGRSRAPRTTGRARPERARSAPPPARLSAERGRLRAGALGPGAVGLKRLRRRRTRRAARSERDVLELWQLARSPGAARLLDRGERLLGVERAQQRDLESQPRAFL